MAAPEAVRRLVERFAEQHETYRQQQYNETQVRREFIDPLFGALGWDIDNQGGKPDQYKDVIHEDAIKVGGLTKAPDYCFKIGGDRKFFVEAKKPAVPLASHQDSAFQLKRYAWSAQLPLGILTDFEEIAVYDCRLRPKQSDPVTKARLFYFKFSELPKRWKEFSDLFSRAAVENGSLDQFTSRKARGSATVDKEFLKEIERWRELLAKNIAVRNKKLTTEELNAAVQRTIDRLVFLRICEDRGIESYGRLMALQNSNRTYEKLVEIFRYADKRYNSGLFHFAEERGRVSPVDTLSLNLNIDDEPLQDIIKHLYYPDSPYEFSVLPTEILGQVYEQFLGKVIRLTSGHHAKIEEKPEVRKAGGVYYTPRYIVDYIVKQTVGELVKGKRPAQVAKLKVLDPACGSGSFLLGAYQYLLDWYRDWYVEDDAKGKRPKHSVGKNPTLYKAAGGEWRLTAPEKRRILLNNIHGVDIDAQAVEVTKLSLLLKVLEDVSANALQQFGVLQERALPDLGNNIKCGNSLIGHDYFDGQMLPDDEELKRINPFDWEDEFSEIMRGGGFDAVIGNPPYFSAITLEKSQHEYLRRKFSDLWASRNDISYYFFLKSANLSQRYTSMIIPRYYLNSYYASSIRQKLLEMGGISILDTRNAQCFKGVNILTNILTLNERGGGGVQYVSASTQNNSIAEEEIIYKSAKELSLSDWSFNSDEKILKTIADSTKCLDDYFYVAKGMSTGLNKAFELEDKLPDIQKNNVRPLIKNGDIRQYHVNATGRWVIYLEDTDSLRNLPQHESHLMKYRTELESRKSAKGLWFHYSAARNKELWNRAGPKIVVPFMATENRFAIEKRPSISTSGDVAALVPKNRNADLYFFTALLNSRLLTFYHLKTSKLKRGGYTEYVSKQLEALPIPEIGPRNKGLEKFISRLAQQISKAHEKPSNTSSDRLIKSAQKRIDTAVYELYGLTNAEIKLVESGSES